MKQQQLQEKLGVIDKINKSTVMKQAYINQMILACYEEVTEIMRETCYKHPSYTDFGWKKNQKFNFDYMKEEIVDLMHFVLNLALISGMDAEEFFNIYCRKNKINIRRNENDY